MPEDNASVSPMGSAASPITRPQVRGERRTVTVLFADVVNSTGLAERLDPEDWTEIMNAAFEHMTAPVHHYEGTVARLMGDGMLAFFGAPTTHEDDPQRAVLAGLDIVAAVRRYDGPAISISTSASASTPAWWSSGRACRGEAPGAGTRGLVPVFSGLYLYHPSRRQPSPAFTVIVDALRYRA